MPLHPRRFGGAADLVAAIAVLVLLAVLPGQGAAENGLILGVHPYRPSEDLSRAFAPLARHLEQRLGMPVSLSIAKDYETHIRAVGEGRVDIAFIGPAAYVLLVRRHGPVPLLARLSVRGKPYFTGVIFCREQSSIRRIRDLRGKRFAFGERESTMGHIVPLFLLEREGIMLKSLSSHVHLQNHENVALGVLAGDFDAGALKDDVFERFRPQGLRALAVSQDIPEHLFVARRTLPPDAVARIRAVLRDISGDPAGRAALRSIRSDVNGLTAADDGDYDPLREILGAVAPGDRLP